MKMMKMTCAAAALLLAAGCDVKVNNESVENQVDALGSQIENAAESTGNVVGQAAESVENRVDEIGNVDLDVNLRTDANKSETNKQ